MTLPLPEQLLHMMGGTANIQRLTHCFSRLRFTLLDEGAIDEQGLSSLPEVVMVLHQSGQIQVALRAGLIDTYQEINKLL
jgi:phosphotransferase system IIB component